ncbi:MAG: hypothetical protein R3F15_06085 [Lysobacterales bacterium]
MTDCDDRATENGRRPDPARRRWLLALIALPLTACGPKRRMGIRGPRVTLAGIEQDASGWHVRVRVQNVIDRDLVLSGLDLQLKLKQSSVPLRMSQLSIRIPSLSSEVLTVPTAMPAGFIAELAAAARRAGGAAYTLLGEIDSSEPERRFKTEYEGFLSPVPGRNDAYR